MNDEGGFYIIAIDRNGNENDFQTLDGFVLDSFHSGKKYKVVDINDYHM